MFIIQNYQFKNRQHTFAFNVDQQIDQLNRNIDTLIDEKKLKKLYKLILIICVSHANQF